MLVAKLEDFLQGKPLNERMKRLMDGEEEEEGAGQETAAAPRNFADGTPIADADREHLRRTLATPGWQVLLKLLDTALQAQEDAARRLSLNRSAPKEEKSAAWETVAANREARMALVGLAEAEIAKAKRAKS